MLEDCRSRLGLFANPKILRVQPKMLEDCRSRRNSPKIANAVQTSNRNRVAKRLCHHHKSQPSRVRIASMNGANPSDSGIAAYSKNVGFQINVILLNSVFSFSSRVGKTASLEWRYLRL